MEKIQVYFWVRAPRNNYTFRIGVQCDDCCLIKVTTEKMSVHLFLTKVMSIYKVTKLLLLKNLSTFDDNKTVHQIGEAGIVNG